MRDQVQQKAQAVIDHVDDVIGYSVAGVTGSVPLWVDTLTGYLELVAVLMAILVGWSTWRLNQTKKKALEKGGEKD